MKSSSKSGFGLFVILIVFMWLMPIGVMAEDSNADGVTTSQQVNANVQNSIKTEINQSVKEIVDSSEEIVTENEFDDIQTITASGTGDNYPEPWRSGGGTPYYYNGVFQFNYDSWGYAVQNCTSWVAWALHDRNGFEIPRAIGNAKEWGGWAKNNGYTVDGNPKIGSVAWWISNHVAWVKSVNSDGTVTIEEYNYNWSGTYNCRNIPINSVQYIHFKDINPDTTPPNISDVKITDVDASGFTVWCHVDDASGRVQFPTWTSANGQDDIIKDWETNPASSGSIDGNNNVSYRVNYNAHNNERGVYNVHIYAYDAVGNRSACAPTGIEIDSNPPTITDTEILNRTPLGYTVKCKVADANGIDRVQFPTWTSANDQDDIQQSWWSNPVASGKIEGDTVTYQVNDADHNYERGAYNTHIYAFDKFGNYTCVTLGTTVENNGSVISEASLNNHRYMIYDDAVTWAQAEVKAEELGGTLATISSQEEQSLIETIIGAGQRARYFLGGTDEGQEGTFRWVTGEPFGLAKWAPGNPDNWSGNENYLQITREGYWNDVSASYNAGGYIIEVDANKLQISSFKTSDDSGSYTNRNISLTAAISGGVAPVQYKFYYKFGDTSTVIQDYSQSDTASFKPVAAGTYTLYVDVKDSEGRTATKNITDYIVQKNIGITYQTQIQNIGWQEPMSNGTMSGTSGQGLRLEAIKIDLDKQGYDIGVSYQTHIENIGWEADTDRGWKSNGVMSGTEGLGYRLEAIQIKLTGGDAEKFDIYYQVHAQNFGWLDWAKNGQSAGTAGFGNRLEAINIVVVPKNAAAPGISDRPFVQK